MAILITRNNIMRPAKLDFKLKQEDDGIYTIENVYEGQYTFFENVPLVENAKASALDRPTELNPGDNKL